MLQENEGHCQLSTQWPHLRPIASAGTVADAGNRPPSCWKTSWNCHSCSAQGTLGREKEAALTAPFPPSPAS